VLSRDGANVHLRLVGALLLALTFSGSTRASDAPPTATLQPSRSNNVFDRYLATDFAPADGFDFPIGHTGRGQDVSSIAAGRVKLAEKCGEPWGNVVMIEHVFYENYEQRHILSLYAHLKEIKVKSGAIVKRRQLIATVGQAHLHLELRRAATLPPACPVSEHSVEPSAEPAAFIRAHRKLPVPHRESTLVLVDQASYTMRLYQDGQLRGEYAVSFGQSKGQKRLQGDNKTPKGMYFVIGKNRGKFAGDYGGYYGGHWIKLNYPNQFDAAWGRAAGLITPRQEASISASWEKRAATLETTRLGGGIGFHGWIKEWSNDGPRHLSWGCVVMHLSDIRRFYDEIPEGAMVVIF